MNSNRFFNTRGMIKVASSITLIVLLSIVVIGCGSAVNTPQTGTDFSYSVRVINRDTNQGIARAKVTLDVPGQAPLETLSDNNGLARIFVGTTHANKPGRLQIEASGFQSHVQNIDIILNALPSEVILSHNTSLTPNPTVVSTSVNLPTIEPSLTSTSEVQAVNTPVTPQADLEATKVPNNARVSVGEVRQTTIDKFSYELVSIEFRPNGTMRWNFSFWNQTKESYYMGFDIESTYLVDEFGNRYPVEDTDYKQRATVQAGVRTNFWFDFLTPRDNATQFTANLIGFVSGGFAYPQFPPIKIVLSVPQAVVLPEPTQAPTLESIVTLNQSETTTIEDFSYELVSIDFRPDGTMRWNFAFWNQTKEAYYMGFDIESTYLVDEFGNRYPVEDTDYKQRVTVQAGVRTNFWFDFLTPRDNATQFTANLIGFVSGGFAYPQFTPIKTVLSVPQAVVLPEPTQAPTLESIVTLNQSEMTTIEDFSYELVSIEFRPDGTMRWNFAFWNQTKKAYYMGFDIESTYLVDEFGNRYPVEDTDYRQRVTVQAGVRTNFWFEFPAPRDNATQFTANLIGFVSGGFAYPEFTPMTIQMPQQ